MRQGRGTPGEKGDAGMEGGHVAVGAGEAERMSCKSRNRAVKLVPLEGLPSGPYALTTGCLFPMIFHLDSPILTTQTAVATACHRGVGVGLGGCEMNESATDLSETAREQLLYTCLP